MEEEKMKEREYLITGIKPNNNGGWSINTQSVFGRNAGQAARNYLSAYPNYNIITLILLDD